MHHCMSLKKVQFQLPTLAYWIPLHTRYSIPSQVIYAH